MTLIIPDDLARGIEACPEEEGRGQTPGQYVLAVVQGRAQRDDLDDEALDQLIAEGLASPASAITQGDWDAKVRAFDERHRGSKVHEPHRSPCAG